MSSLIDLVQEAERQLTICNACRYCEGYCAVFPALERRLTLGERGVAYLANLCHDCRACYQACMYAPPHEFGVDIPRLLSAVRAKTYEEYARPRPLAPVFRHGPTATAAAVLLGLVLWLVAVAATGNLGALSTAHSEAGTFYRVVPYYLMLVPALVGTALVAASMMAGFALFWSAAARSRGELLRAGAWWRAAADALRLRHMSGGGAGCFYPDEERPSSVRRWLHSLVFYGFVAAFVSTALAALYQDLLGRMPPYPLLSPPVLFGAAGGVAMIAGSSGLIWLKVIARPRRDTLGMDLAFLVTLDLASITGMLLLALRDSPFMGILLVLHLGVLVGLFATAPYGKFVHFVYRFGALLLNRLEEAEEVI